MNVAAAPYTDSALIVEEHNTTITGQLLAALAHSKHIGTADKVNRCYMANARHGDESFVDVKNGFIFLDDVFNLLFNFF